MDTAVAVGGYAGGAAQSLFDFNVGIITKMRRHRLLKSKMDVAMDLHNVRRFDKKPGPELVCGGDKASMTKALYETYGTVQLPVNGQRLIVCMVTFSTGDDHAGTVRALLDACARHGIRAGTVMADRGFFSRGVIGVLNDSGVTSVLPRCALHALPDTGRYLPLSVTNEPVISTTHPMNRFMVNRSPPAQPPQSTPLSTNRVILHMLYMRSGR